MILSTLLNAPVNWLMKSLNIPISWSAKLCLFSMGWKLLDDNIFNRLKQFNRSVIVFSHTSYADFYILVLYLLAYPELLHKVRTLVKPQPFEYAGTLLTNLGAIPSTRLEDKDGGAVKRICTELKSLNNYIFLISPKGTIINRPWRSGYFHIASQLDATIFVAGLDYEKKSVIVSNPYSPKDYDENSIQPILKSDISQIVPLFPEGEVVPIRKHDYNKRTIIDKTRLISVFIGSLLVYLIYSSR
jgi:1-acyl-sn-glycerol-3-phosphate acyltransferase